MFNVTGGELVIILLVALIVLGPDKLPDAIRKVARLYGELRRMSQGFQNEIRDALDEPLREVRDTMNTMKGGFSDLGSDHPSDPPAGTRMTATNGDAAAPDGAGAAVEPPPPEPETVAVAEASATPVDATPTEPAPMAEPAEPVVPANGTAVRDEPALTLEELAASPAEPSPPPANGTTIAFVEPAAPVQNEHT